MHFVTQLFIDSNVVLECLPLAELPWGTLDPVGPVLLLATPTVLREIDLKKRDGRLGPRAREFNRLLAPLVENGEPVLVTDGPPEVYITAAHCRSIDWKQYDDLDPGDNDARIVAEILHAKKHDSASSGGELRVVSQDLNLLISASRHQIATFRIPEEWLRPPEQHPKDSENVRLKQELQQLRRTEPEFAIDIEVAQPVSVLAVDALSPDQARAYTAALLQAHPKPQRAAHGFVEVNLDPGFDKKYEQYATQEVPRYVECVHQRLELFYGQTPITVTVKNVGNVRADNAIVEVEIVGGWINARPIAVSPRGPAAPRRASPFDSILDRSIPSVVRKVDRHEFQVDLEKRSNYFTAQCEDFRHGQEWSFTGILWLDPHFDRDAVVKVKVTAANLHGHSSKVQPIRRVVEHVQATSLIDLQKLKAVRAPRIQPLIDEAIAAKAYSRIDWG